MKKRGISIVGIIVFVGLIALISWGLNYIITKDFVTVRAPTAPITTQNASTTVSAILVATTTPLKTTAVATSTQTSSALTITFTDKGFSPASLTVKKGQTITFVNNSSGKMWVSANPFPTASDYPVFNEKVGADNGSSWSFTFDKTGTWFYHNHYSPAQGAKIVVNAQ